MANSHNQPPYAMRQLPGAMPPTPPVHQQGQLNHGDNTAGFPAQYLDLTSGNANYPTPPLPLPLNTTGADATNTAMQVDPPQTSHNGFSGGSNRGGNPDPVQAAQTAFGQYQNSQQSLHQRQQQQQQQDQQALQQRHFQQQQQEQQALQQRHFQQQQAVQQQQSLQQQTLQPPLQPLPNQHFATALEWWTQFGPTFQQLSGWKDVLAEIAQTQLGDLNVTKSGRLGPRDSSSSWFNYNSHQRCQETIDRLRHDRNEERSNALAAKNDYQNLFSIYQKLKAENEAFRAQIFSIGTGRAPIHDELFYIQKFESLRGTIEQGALKLCRAQAKGEKLSLDAEKATLKSLVEMGPYGELAVKTFTETKYTMPLLYNQLTWRIALIRHIVALFLLDRVFSPFAFGISDELSDGLKRIQDDVVEREGQSSNVLMINQAIGRGVLRFLPDQPERRQIAVLELQDLLKVLLPLDPNNQLEPFVAKVVNAAVDFKMAAVEEQAIYHVFWVKYSDPYDDHRMEVAEEDEPEGPVLLCTFPGLERWHRDEKEHEQIPVVKAFTLMKQTLKSLLRSQTS